MGETRARRSFGTLRALLLALTAIAGVMLCFTVMHGLHPEQSTSAVSVSNFRSSAIKTRTACSTISVPMPSPGKMAIFMMRCSQ